MDPVPRITRLGFRKWYERQLIGGHVASVICVMCMVAVAICLEEFTYPAPSFATAVRLGVIASAGIVGWKCWLYYHRVMLQAWRFGESSVCKKCQLYGRFVIFTSGRTTPVATASDPEPESDVWMNVSCK